MILQPFHDWRKHYVNLYENKCIKHRFSIIKSNCIRKTFFTEQITEAEAELHIHFDQKQLLTANSALLDLLEKIKTETAYKMKKMILICFNSYFRKITIAQKDYENVSLFSLSHRAPC